MNTVFDVSRQRFPEISPAAFQHPLDRAATDNLKKIKGIDVVVAKLIEFGYERLHHFLHMANFVHVQPSQFPLIYEMVRESSAILDMPEPNVYIAQTPIVNAYTFGHNRPYIVIYSGLLELMTDDEVMAVIAHELGHIKCGHVLYHTMAREFGTIVAILRDSFPIVGNLLGTALQLALKVALVQWQRRSELSADRAALLVMQDPYPCIRMLAKLAGGSQRYSEQLSPEQFLEQARAYSEDGDKTNVDKFYRFLVNFNFGMDSHPFAIERAKYLNDWIDSPEYDQIMRGIYPQLKRTSDGKCSNCGSKSDKKAKFCPNCGFPLVSASTVEEA